MKLMTIAAAVFAFSACQLPAGEECQKHPEYEQLSLQGRVTLVEKDFLDKTGEIKTKKVYHLTADDAVTELPLHRNCSGKADVALAPYIDRMVTVTARGLNRRSLDGKSLIFVHKLLSVRENSAGTNGEAVSLVRPGSGYDSFNVRGRLVHQEKLHVNKQGEVTTIDEFHLKTADSILKLPVSTETKEKSPINLRAYIGQDVTIAALGIQRPNKTGRTLTYLHELVGVRESEPVTASDTF